MSVLTYAEDGATVTEFAYTASQMTEYGQACRAAALEEAINCYSPDDTACSYIEKIEDLKS